MSMTLGTHTLTYYPSDFTIPRPKRSNAYVETYESVEHFTWGFFDAGKIVELIWNYLPSTEFASLDAVFQGDVEVVWDPGISDDGTTYNVQILDFTGDFFESVETETEIWRQNCRMTLLIMSIESES